jgi:uncharacterized Zn-binding protein involved in type VI secretion
VPASVRIGDSLDTGHGCTGVTTLADSNQGTVYADKILISVPGAPTVVHTILDGVCVPHTDVLHVGSPNVFCEGKPMGRIGDAADAGAMISGSPTTFANG